MKQEKGKRREKYIYIYIYTKENAKKTKRIRRR